MVRTKHTVEEILADQTVSDPGFKAAVLRYFNPVGAHSSGEIGEDPNGIPDNLVPFVCQVANGKLEKLQVFGTDYPTPDGTAIRDYLHVVDLADAHVRSLKALSANEKSFVCNLGNGERVLCHGSDCGFRAGNWEDNSFRAFRQEPGDVTEVWAEPSLARELLGWESKHSLEQMLSDAWRWQEKNPNGYDSL